MTPDQQRAIAIAQAKLKLSAGQSEQTPLQQRIANARVTPERAAEQAQIDQIAEDRMVLDRTGPVLSAVTKFNQGLPFIGQWTDEATGAVGNALGLDGERITQDVRATQDAMGRQYPKTSMGLQVAGGITGAIPAAAMAPSVAVPASIAGRVGAGLGVGAVVGATEGAVSGAGAGTEGDRMSPAITGAAVGGALGGAIGAAAPAVFSGVKNVVEWAKGRDVKQIARVLGIDKPAATVVRNAIEADDLTAAAAALRRAGPDAMLGDAGYASSQLLDTAVAQGGKAVSIGRNAVEARAAAANTRLTNTLDATLGKPQGMKTAAKAVANRTAQVRQQVYDRAYSQPIDYASPHGRAIEETLSRVPPKRLNAAIETANDFMRANGVKNQQILADIADDGTVTFREMPNVQQLDELKKALGNQGAEAVDQFGRKTAEGRMLANLANQVRDAVGEAVPIYKTAVKLGGDKIAEDNALALGGNLLKPNVTREAVAEAMDGASREAKAAARQGLRTYIDDTLANVKQAISSPSTDTKEAMKLVTDMRSRANFTKVEMVLGKPQADRLYKALDEAAAHLELRVAIAKGSQTAVRKSGKEAADTALTPGFIGEAARGNFLQSPKKIMQILTKTTPADDAARSQEMYAQIAAALTQIKGPAAERALAQMQQAIAGQPLSTAQASQIARIVTGAVALTGYQSGSQSLTNRLGGR